MAVIPRPAATVMLVRDAPTLRVFMLRRTPRATFVGGHHVFPGGSVDPGDSAPALLARCVGLDDASASAVVGVPSGGLAWWVAAVRETFEEAGVLLGVDATGAPVDTAADGVADRLAQARRALHRRDASFAEVVASLDVHLDASRLVPFSHWITPALASKRFDTWFFVAEAPDGHVYRHDDGETVASEWVAPADALSRADAGRFPIIFPTVKSLEALGAFEHASELVDAARRHVAGADGPGLGIRLPDGLGPAVFEPLPRRAGAAG